MADGLILWENDAVVAIATGIKKKSTNVKTGGEIQTYFLVKSENPVEAVKTGADREICFNCDLRPLAVAKFNAKPRNAHQKKKPCYVKKWRGPAQVWKAYSAGKYPKLDPNDLSAFENRVVRFGTYGDPVLLPFNLMQAIAARAAGHTGYTRQWRKTWFAAYKQYLMASCRLDDFEEAESMGWRTFVVRPKNSPSIPKHVLCPASKEGGRRTTCDRCQLCSGTSLNARSVEIPEHN